MAKREDKTQGEAPATTRKLSPKQEHFCQVYAESKSASVAYREAYNVENMKASSVHVNACKLLKDAKVALRVEEILGKQARAFEITRETLTEGYFEAIEIARAEKQATALTGAVTALGKLHGLITDRVDHAHKHTLGDEFEAFIRGLSRDRGMKTIDHDA